MATYKRAREPRTSTKELVLRLHILQSPEMVRTVEKLYARYRKHAVPVVELRKLLDKEMGERTLSEELNAMREGR
ncbi:MAG: hypothetical protein Q8O86_00180 [Dehalococcoidia bacterium]|nr:hypothetical protein [Dehalococcoidia bacterium]